MKRCYTLLTILLSSYCLVMAQTKEASVSENLFLKKVLSADINYFDKQDKIEPLVWNAHSTFKGVYLKHLILGKETENQLSCHIVKVEPNCILDTHQHDGKIEVHEVVGGNGTMFLDKKEISYTVGQICIIPANMPHKVVAGKDGLYLFAKFTPALQ